MFNYIQEIKTYDGIYNEDAVLNANSQLLTLCTCNVDGSKRFVVHGVLIGLQNQKKINLKVDKHNIQSYYKIKASTCRKK